MEYFVIKFPFNSVRTIVGLYFFFGRDPRPPRFQTRLTPLSIRTGSEWYSGRSSVLVSVAFPFAVPYLGVFPFNLLHLPLNFIRVSSSCMSSGLFRSTLHLLTFSASFQ